MKITSLFTTFFFASAVMAAPGAEHLIYSLTVFTQALVQDRQELRSPRVHQRPRGMRRVSLRWF
ncbi:hypothetical protein PtrSN002B_001946 [Pyrenophora tritici-repentis]|nr:hypothetical protein PtrV1_05780 [Pyrenophora tritici-repentis]KAF7450513.1 hypothetical protein A1F99_051290 [Pyrenophora tritici-repentis]KAI0584220.1 hypothetical protein Alg215_03181 [Pyrenophora tritici-repentis]KAI1541947.1 hypothetical protein PtrSN001C_004344 [Pyrenophora tritici-repentis]KAI1545653.1 hypothetical protein PtrSN001A_002270 [Pyrenophora tritici-repentis]